jgi:signal transduction histidine kinase/ligand-binding sensor domain-containing protein
MDVHILDAMKTDFSGAAMGNFRFLTLYLLFISTMLWSQAPLIKFHHLGAGSSLSQFSVFSNLQDSRGFIWLGTEDGLNRWDGIRMKVYKPGQEAGEGLTHNYIRALLEDTEGRIWIGTWGGGISILDTSTDSFIPFSELSSSGGDFPERDIFDLLLDRNGSIWIAAWNTGLYRYDPGNRSLSNYTANMERGRSLSSNNLYTLQEGRDGTIWVGTQAGLDVLNPDTGAVVSYLPDGTEGAISGGDVRAVLEDSRGNIWAGTFGGLNLLARGEDAFIPFLPEEGDPESISGVDIHSIIEDSRGNIWIGTYDGGLNHFDTESGIFTRYTRSPENPDSLADDSVRTLYEDSSGLIWVGTLGGGVDRFTPGTQPFMLYSADPDTPGSLSNDNLWDMVLDPTGDLWIGTRGGGLNRYNPDTGIFHHYRHDPADPGSISLDIVRSLYLDNGDTLWVGTHDGLNRYSREDDSFTRFHHDPEDPGSLGGNSIWCIFKDSSGVLWVGTRTGGLSRFNNETEEWHTFRYDPEDLESISSNFVYTIFEDRNSNLWLGTIGGGLNLFLPETETFKRYQPDPKVPFTLSNSFVLFIHEDEEGLLWLGTNGGGLNVFDRETEKFTHYTTADGLPNDVVYGFLEDDEGRYWISTNSGLSRFSPEEGLFRNYDASDGLGIHEFNGKSFVKGRYGRMYFGGANGLTSFRPEEILDNPFVTPVVLTRLLLFNKEVAVGENEEGRTILPRSLFDLDTVTLRYNDSVIALEFAALSYQNPEKNQYAYKMEDLEKEWNFVGNRSFATYTTLPPGEYTFRVKGSNEDGIWNEEGRSIKITILPPFWQTFWFRLLMILLLGILIILGHEMRVRGMKKRNILLETRVDERTRELAVVNTKLEEVNSELKDFAYVVSHDLKAPLRGISQLSTWLSEDHREGLGKEGMEQIDLLQGRVNRMNNLVDGILRYSRLGRSEDLESEINLSFLLPNIIKRLESPEGIIFEIQEGLPKITMNQTKIEEVFQNLISNAVKYMGKPKGIIKIGFTELSGYWEFRVEDNGPGIEKKYHDKIFQIFQTLKARDDFESTGIGLFIVKKIIAGAGGEIRLKSEPGKGSVFLFTLPKKGGTP